MIQFKHTAKKPSARMFEFIWASFCEHGTSHSAAGATLSWLMERAEADGIPYTLHAQPGLGYFIKRAEPM